MKSANKYYDDPELLEKMQELGINIEDEDDEVEDTKVVVENPEDFGNDDNIDVDMELENLESAGITEDEIESIFAVDAQSIDSSNNALDSDSEKSRKKKMKQAEVDNALVREYVENPTHDAFNKLWTRFYFGVKGYAYKFLKDWDSADDIACQTFERAWENRDKYDINKAKFSTWLYIICRNLCLGEINRRTKCNLVSNDISDMYDSAMMTSSIALSTDSTQYTVESGTIVANTASDLQQKMYDTSIIEIDKLGGNYTTILRMKLVEDMKIREIADALNMKESTVKNYLYKGKETIEAALKTKYKELYEMYMESAADEASKMM